MIFPVLPPKPRAHPRYAEVEASRRAVEQWEMKRQQKFLTVLRRRSMGRAVAACLGLLCALCLAFGALSVGVLIGGIAIGIALAARSSVPLAMSDCGRPTEIQMVRYSRWENDYLLSRQHRQDFVARCECPSCGFLDTHMMGAEPCPVPWGDVIRQCLVCGREWAQS